MTSKFQSLIKIIMSACFVLLLGMSLIYADQKCRINCKKACGNSCLAEYDACQKKCANKFHLNKNMEGLYLLCCKDGKSRCVSKCTQECSA